MPHSLDIRQDVNLQQYNTLSVDAVATQFITIHSIDDLQEALAYLKGRPFIMLGGGSNLLFDQPVIQETVLWMNIRGIQVLDQTATHVLVKAMAGENWDQFVAWCVEHNFGGLQNLSLIPGTVGAAPVQNIGAYGVELKDYVSKVEVVNIASGDVEELTAQQCQFGYRDSIFKRSGSRHRVVTSVTFELSINDHEMKLEYGDLRNRLESLIAPGISDIREAVIAIRSGKLPDPSRLPNAGSFYKNPVLNPDEFARLQQGHPDVPHYPQTDGQVKVPAGWLIEQCGWKGRCLDNACVHTDHALVLVNQGGASGENIMNLAQSIQHDVLTRFGIELNLEVNRSSAAVFSEY